ncbi:protein ENHANCED DISEASE RESISTANCE 2-like [Tripterygium wilfordii]|uniref:Protein ENHANCED DISEASE RESISTANCE 2-like n=1 Tax=Tripterygium wilfordii TaxID=458696 RepID=A0A7J7D882_TRIWF|nr:protein ENHANCED DISEASE RESISTANCE 2-like [Tripterygium wilfordii]KAF5742542.1 protein ENHANCED DISEASE RESISTANCE 2-like [Tripterygium wilfordii]
MGISQTEGKMEGWLYTIGSNRFGLQFSRKRYFILHENSLKSYKMIPTSDKEEPVRSAIIDSSIRVADDGRESIHRKVFFIFTLYNNLNHHDQLKLGASSSEEAAKWIRSLKDVAIKEFPNSANNLVACSKKGWTPLRLSFTKGREHTRSIDWTNHLSIHTEAMTSDVIAPSPWKIFGCQNGLRLFKESKDWDSRERHWDDNPAIMAVGAVDGSSEAIFRILMSLGPSRSEWDFCFYRGNVVDHLDGHTDIIRKELYSDWLPWGMKRRDLLLRRYWRREDDGTYVILYHSVYHKKCLPQKGYVRAWLKSGGYVVTPVNQGKQSLVKHMLSIDWKFWKSYLRSSSARSITIRMLERVAALRELFRARTGNFSSEILSREVGRATELLQSDNTDAKNEVQESEKNEKIGENAALLDDGLEKITSGRTSLMGLNDACDEFFDVPEATDYDHYENGWSCATSPDLHSQSSHQSRLPSAAGLVKKLHDLAVQKKGYMDLQEVAREDGFSCPYGATLQKDSSCSLPCSWAAADPSTFLIRGENYLKDHQKTKAKGTLMQMVGADWLRSDKREDDLGSRPDSIVQKYAARGGPEFFFIVNIQVPGTTTYTLALYYMMKTPLEENPLLYKFVNGDDAYRNSRFKLIPYISKGSWIVKQSVGKKACLVGQALEAIYFRGKNYLELEIDVGSSTVARGVVNLVLGYLNNLVIEMAFLIQGNTQEELPETLLGTCRINYLDASKSALVVP